MIYSQLKVQARAIAYQISKEGGLFDRDLTARIFSLWWNLEAQGWDIRSGSKDVLCH